MSLESGTYISDLVVTNPTGTDPKSEGDNHLRLIKTVVVNTFPNIDGAVTATQAEINILDGATVTFDELNLLDGSVAGTAVASKALVLGATKNIDTIDVAKDGFKIGGTAMTCTAAELNILDGVTGVTPAEISYLGDVTSLIQGQLDLKAPLANAVLTGIPTAPTAATVTNTTQLATTAFVQNVAMNSALPTQVNGYALTSNGTDAAFNLEVADLVRVSNNLSDVTAATARTNLDVYSKSETIAAAIPSGGIIMWSGAISAIPSGWYLCDGANGTPDLRGRFVIAADADSGGNYNVGANADGTIPSHSHSFSGTSSSAGGHSHVALANGIPTSNTGGSLTLLENDILTTANGAQNYGTTGTEPSHTHSVSGTTGTNGTGTAVIAKHYALAYIMKS